MKLRTTIALLTAAVGLTSLTAHAQSTTEWEGSADVRYTTRYVYRGTKKAGQSVQANVDFTPVSGQNGFYVGGWINQPFASERDNEFDLYGGYIYNYEGFEFSGGLTGYFYPEADGYDNDYSYELMLGAKREILPNWGVSANLYYDIRLETMTYEASTGYRIPYTLESFKSSVDFSAFLGYSDGNDLYPDAPGPKIKDTYSYYGATISNTVWFTKNLRATVAIQYGDSINKAGAKDLSDNLYGYVAVGVRW